MNAALGQPRMTREAFFDWAQAQNERYEFDGFRPVAMTGGLYSHSRICQNVYFALRTRLRGPCQVLGPDLGLATVGDTVRYPDALVTCSEVAMAARLAPDVSIVFEVLSPGSDRLDKVVKRDEYRAIPSLRRYVVLERGRVAATVFWRGTPADDWTVTELAAVDALALPEVGIEVPVTEFYANIEFGTAPA